MALLMGIDTGGTYTDAVIFDDETREVISSAKALTSKHDLSICVSEATAAALADIDPSKVALVSLSTTLATNALVEQHGFPVGLILIGQDDKALDRAGLRQALGSDPVLFLDGGHGTDGLERAPLNLDAAQADIEALTGKVSAVAVCGYFGTRNPSHEIAVRDAVRRLTDLPVTCAHEMASALDAPRRALTALLNARLISLIQQLIRAVSAMLDQSGIDAPLMVVKGDGSLIAADTALTRPVETILSGPAASVIGAQFLCNRPDCVISDIGGTTTDIAVLKDGKPVLADDGAVVGGYRTMVEAIAVHTIGLGGDSEIGLDDEKQLRVGPRRMVPVSLLARDNPGIVDILKTQLDRAWPKPIDGRFAVKLRDLKAGTLSRGEQRIWDMLQDGPKSLEALLAARAPEQPLLRLVDRGLVILSGFTPSDAAHVLGLQDSWNTEAAKLSAGLHARTERRPGIPLAANGDDLARKVIDRLTVQSCMAMVEAVIPDAPGRSARRFMTEAFAHRSDQEDADSLVGFEVRLHRPLIGIGAPAQTYYPEIAKRLHTDFDVPRFAEVCNAVGAVAGGVSQRVHILITSPAEGLFRVHALEGVEDFRFLEDAAARATDIATTEAERRALEAGASEIRTETNRDDRVATVAGSFDVFIESRITATAFGRPMLAVR
ncbi:hydantoinase/oxoprolinase family protein [Rhodospirillaceae bacterium KN72]|uniref:Hydantoinase/oxoprolinase family protein n=1 Tax=Pacificispira spongiicola TaxID=2729598 RepID=A0A7Y0HG02_9PROT|nr:hydantoinase/oxoprolinase family protein [Pacificispira spongiicola]NMM46371.1 hydantoinase/oxoprolinase family protein [Pacificispira spongiicola]